MKYGEERMGGREEVDVLISAQREKETETTPARAF